MTKWMWMTQGSGNVDDSDPEFKATLIVNLSTIECEKLNVNLIVKARRQSSKVG